MQTVFYTTIISFFLTGCAGGYFYPATTNTKVTVYPQAFSFHQNPFNCIFTPGDTPISESSLVSIVGKPDDRKTDNDVEYLYYNEELIWTGVVGQVTILPLPIIFPANKQYCRLKIVGGEVIEGAKVEGNKVKGFLCGLLYDGGYNNGRLACETVTNQR
ncbi:hypothetical protein H0A36_26500 [Endozoicomonas sp. SM1973]|uniref:Uncharacterized protein n=1 Tax=Spartinivicinus marinus TaxID=2994442 RepID=A0A853I6N1_9GAMM|nr:hypothetical protein [Spartinivicinus marinus]MCX4030237.1 hypothetical protein [Spartinivicinus marinus]NYZ69570.1 hypothetical protein [Spartinivicinus marinus]